MNKKITALSIAIVLFAISFATVGYDDAKTQTDISYANINTFAEEQAVSSTASLGEFVSNKVNGVTDLGGIIGDVSDIGNSLGGLIGGGSSGGGLGGLGSGFGDAIGGIGDALGGILGGGSGGSNGSGGSSGTGNVTYDVNTETIGYIDIVPAVSDYTPINTSSASSTTDVAVNETVDFAATTNPYKKPTGELKGGDKGEGVKWMQWIFIYTRYGLKDDGITGVFDEDTMAVVKKLQKENGLTIDGIVDDEVIDKIDLLYFKSIYSTTAPVSATEADTVVSPTVSQNTENKGEKTVGIVAIVLIIVLIWLTAIGGIVFLFVMKKKKGKDQKNNKKKKSSKKSAPVEDDTVIETASVSEEGTSTIAEMFDKLD